MSKFEPPFPCTNPNYGRDDVPLWEAAWWTRHKDVPHEWRVACLYPVHPEGLLCTDDEFVMPDLGKVDINTLDPEAKARCQYLIARYGAENMISIALGEWAEKLGYKPVEEANKELDPIFQREVLYEAFTEDYDKAMEKWGYLFGLYNEKTGGDIEKETALSDDFEYDPNYIPRPKR